MVQTELVMFDGVDVKPGVDNVRLNGQLLDIFECISDMGWYSLKDIEEETGHGQASISAQLRNLRKSRFGGYIIDRKRAFDGSGLYLYRLVGKGKQEEL